MTEEANSLTQRATALHGDVVGYSALTADNEIETYNTLQVLRRIIEQAVDAHGGSLASFVGDEFLAVLPSEDSGVSAAIEIQRSIAKENNRLPDGRKMRFRLGIHVGDVYSAGDRWYGTPSISRHGSRHSQNPAASMFHYKFWINSAAAPSKSNLSVQPG